MHTDADLFFPFEMRKEPLKLNQMDVEKSKCPIFGSPDRFLLSFSNFYLKLRQKKLEWNNLCRKNNEWVKLEYLVKTRKPFETPQNKELLYDWCSRLYQSGHKFLKFYKLCKSLYH